ncbi:hypothetical protein JTB14_036857 [Gonioctena quinquepunctata]|nr:hypothetical protein JTB14_036857 [Gonioctena quinquepunctata]
MVYAFGTGEENCLLASRVYAARHPKVKSFEILKERFERTGHIEYEKKSRAETILTDEIQLATSLAVVENHELSVREISRDLEISKSSVTRSLKCNKFHPHHVQLHQELIESDFLNRV